ncbi:penicillin acylase family protein [Echinicola marina]|uniref:penicillin acylase family protein n=1 Tax=Echinicola marina TaxID=2859768 RepID=UPI001CF63774|nr:penicillin acylase family protein [Echinicola marina]UCS93263.1 penicillin acylase family protein [Echinicola marina]
MKYFGFLIVFIFTLILAVGLSVKLGPVPPLGYLMDPFHGFWQNSYSEDETVKKSVKITGLEAEVKINYDENLIPHIFAQNEHDLMMAQGYVTARHRLWQMEFQTRAAAGRIAEIVGPVALEFDRMQRRKGLGYGAEAGLEYIKNNDPETLSLIEAYASGVNQYIDQMDMGELPVEYKLLDYRPEPWTPYKTVLLLKYMADMLVGDKDVEYTHLRKVLGEAGMNKFFPDYPGVNDPVIEMDKKWDFIPLEVQRPEGLDYPDFSILQEALPDPEPGVGSNNWAVSGAKTQSGNPILANDPHLGLNLPSLWFTLQLSTPAYTVKGASLPGALGVISGFNEDIAWGVTNATRDVRDWYSIEFKDENRLEYRYNDQWIQSTHRIEEIAVQGDSAFLDTVIYTHYGPVMYDHSFMPNKQKVNFALKWTALDGSNEQRTFLDLNRAKDHDDFIAALDHFTAPAQNFAFASKEGDIALKVQGKFPLKWPEQGKYLMDGNDARYEWTGYIPNEQNPATLNPDRGFVSSANQYSVGSDYPYYIFDDSFEEYRNRRINSRLTEMQDISVEDIKSLQFDDYNLHAAEVLPVMLNYLTADSSQVFESPATALIDTLSRWDFYADPEKTAPVIFDIWWEKLRSSVWRKLSEIPGAIVLPDNYRTAKFLIETPNDSIFDQAATNAKVETASDHIESTFFEAVEEWSTLVEKDENLNWYRYKGTSILHLVPNFAAFSHQNIKTGGGKSIINATSSRHGASWRMVVELGDKVNAFGIYPGGQSGNPGSKFYDNMIPLWAEGKYLDFGLRSSDQTEHLLYSTTMVPN